MSADSAGRGPGLIWLCGLVALLFSGLLFYSQTQAFSWDEGFHLLASALILRGKRPYLDFCFPQTPLNAYFYAGWMRVFGESWQAAQVAASILTAAAILLTASYVLKRYPVREWRLAGAILAALFVGLNDTVVFFGTIAQAYALCLLLLVASFRVAVVAVERVSPLVSATSGLLAGAAAASSLLTAPAVPVLLGWTLFANRAGNRWTKMVAFLAAAALPLTPVLWLFLQSPRVVLFNVAGYQLFGRRAKWEGATSHDLNVLTSWVDSGPALLLGALALAGFAFLARKTNWPRAIRLEFYLCAWLAGGIALEIGAAHPTFSWYFVFTVPFLAILAIAGFAEVTARLYRPDRQALPVMIVSVLLAVGLWRALQQDIQEMNWPKMEGIARQILKVTPPNGSIWAGEQFFFLTHRDPPDGMEFQAAQKMEMPMSEAAPLHILPAQELARRVAAGAYDTIQNCDQDRIKELGLPQKYRNNEDLEECTIFWKKK
ncbi:MAG TPA: hypothetical protein VF146_10175 [Bryobacteraceae bacterium]